MTSLPWRETVKEECTLKKYTVAKSLFWPLCSFMHITVILLASI